MSGRKKLATVWDDPPNCKPCLAVLLIMVQVCSLCLLVVGSALVAVPGLMPGVDMRELFPDRDNATINAACGTDRLYFCPRWPGVAPSEANLGQWYETLSLYIGGGGLFSLVITFIASVATVFDVQPALFLTTMMIPSAMAIEWRLVDLVVYPESPFHMWGQDAIARQFQSQYRVDPFETNNFTLFVNRIMVAFKCCGTHGPDDARLDPPVEIIDHVGTKLSFQHPAACCIREPGPHIGNRSLEKLMVIHRDSCHFESYEYTINQEGCFRKVFQHVYDNYSTPFLVVILLLIGLQSLETIFAVLVLLRRKPQRPHTVSRRSSRYSQRNSSRQGEESSDAGSSKEHSTTGKSAPHPTKGESHRATLKGKASMGPLSMSTAEETSRGLGVTHRSFVTRGSDHQTHSQTPSTRSVTSSWFQPPHYQHHSRPWGGGGGGGGRAARDDEKSGQTLDDSKTSGSQSWRLAAVRSAWPLKLKDILIWQIPSRKASQHSTAID